MLPEVVQAVISTHGRGATTVSTGTVLTQGPASEDSLNFHGTPPQGGTVQASLPLQSNRNPRARTNVSLGRLDTQHLGSVNSSHSTSLATANCNMEPVTHPLELLQLFLILGLAVFIQGTYTATLVMVLISVIGVLEYSVMNAQHDYQVEFGGNPITGSAGGITGQGGNRVAV